MKLNCKLIIIGLILGISSIFLACSNKDYVEIDKDSVTQKLTYVFPYKARNGNIYIFHSNYVIKFDTVTYSKEPVNIWSGDTVWFHVDRNNTILSEFSDSVTRYRVWKQYKNGRITFPSPNVIKIDSTPEEKLDYKIKIARKKAENLCLERGHILKSYKSELYKLLESRHYSNSLSKIYNPVPYLCGYSWDSVKVLDQKDATIIETTTFGKKFCFRCVECVEIKEKEETKILWKKGS